MKKKILVSIVIVSLNTKKDFIKTLNSSLNQSLKYKEIIVIDGLSNDGTINIINKNKKKLSKIVIEKDKGIYDAMNKGIKLSKGKWIIFMNSGDVFFKKHILEDFSNKNLDNFDVVYGDTHVVSKNLNYIIKANKFTINTCVMPFNHQSSIIKTKLLKKKSFSKKYKYSSDFNFFYQSFLKNKKFKSFNKVISSIKSGGLSDTDRQDVLNENFLILKKEGLYLNCFILTLVKLSQYIKSSIKLIISENLKTTLLKKKYKINKI